MRSRIKILCAIIALLLSLDIAGQAQSHKLPPPQMEGVSGDSVPPPPGLPIDFGISALLAAGLGLGIHHLRKRK
ncbi:PID-CTERM protein-sorting domain-containing protein [Salegentibacter maritimus]|uniref:VPEID-CTERM protein sorting domain-containing protein n=1 Tax=Salegentibacter maritimus TaxID=2794347 RepID=A0ABS0TIN0_9FLAO|nr:hypothetical protein [Salegentibacter maritimus]MBI6120920.1 hypothetical protein [Salegentibacter maritimus]